MNNNQRYKVLFVGEVGSGKTTAVATVSDIKPVTTEAKISHDTTADKTHTTVAFDYGEAKLPFLADRLRLYGLPGQKRFDFMWEILSKGAIGIALLADNSKEESLQEFKVFLNHFMDVIQRVKLAITVGITKNDIAARFSLDDYRLVMAEAGLNPPIFSVDMRVKEDVLLLVNALLSQIEAQHIINRLNH